MRISIHLPALTQSSQNFFIPYSLLICQVFFYFSEIKAITSILSTCAVIFLCTYALSSNITPTVHYMRFRRLIFSRNSPFCLYFLDRIADKLIVVGMDTLGHRCLNKMEFIGVKPVYSYYASLVRERVEARQQKLKSRAAGSRKRRPAGAGNKLRTRMPEELKRFNKYSIEQIEEMIMGLEQELTDMKERFGDPTIYKNPNQLAQLQKSFDTKNAELNLLYRAYGHRAG